jgi:ribonuclease D
MKKNKEDSADRGRPRRQHASPPKTGEGSAVVRQEGLIQDAEGVAALAERLAKAPIIAFDTEFIRERTFFPQLGLLQIADRETSWLLDPLALRSADLKPLLKILTDPEILKAGHAIEQDQECLYSSYGIVASPVLDTAIGAALTGRGDQIGLAALVRKVLGVRLPKGHTRTDWLKRPLPAVMSKYALADVEYLVETAEILLEDLDRRKRRDWALRLSAEFARPERYQPNPEALTEKLAAGKRLGPVEHAVLRELVGWREDRVRKANLPRRWIADDPLLVKLAHARPSQAEDLSNFRGLGAKTLQNGSAEILKAIAQGIQSASEQKTSRAPEADSGEPEDGPALAALKCFLNLLAHAQEVPIRFLVDPDSLPGLLRGRFQTVDDLHESGLLKQAAVDLFGEELIAVLNGRRALRMKAGRAEMYTP